MFRRYYMAFKQYKEIRYEGIHQSHEGAFRSQSREALKDASEKDHVRLRGPGRSWDCPTHSFQAPEDPGRRRFGGSEEGWTLGELLPDRRRPQPIRGEPAGKSDALARR